MSCELLLDLQYVVHLIGKKSETSEAIEYIKHHLKWLEFSFKEEEKGKHVFKRLLNNLNDNVIKHTGNYIGYVDAHQELYWIFNSYYDKAYEFANVVGERNKIREYLLCAEFWRYVFLK